MTKLNISLSQGQAQFALWLEDNLPHLMNLFDFEERIFLKDNVEIYLSTASHGEAIMAKFVLGIWMQENKFNFDFIEAASVLDQGQMKVVTDWMSKPIWP